MKIAILIILFCVTAVFSVSAQIPSPMFIQDVVWSPDGKYIAFTGIHDLDRTTNTVKSDIYVVRVDGTEFRQMTDNEKNEYYVSWIKGRITFGAETPGTKDSSIFTVDQDGSNLRQVSKNGTNARAPSASSDGKRVVFVSARDGGKPQIYVINADGSDEKRLTSDPLVGFYNPQFSPNAKQIVYYAEKGDNLDQVWVMNADGSHQTLVTGGIGHNIYPGWTPDGKRIIFSSSNREKDAAGAFIKGSYVHLINPDGTGLTKLGDVKSFYARFSPDGKKIAYIAGGFPQSSIYIANADGSGATKITK